MDPLTEMPREIYALLVKKAQADGDSITSAGRVESVALNSTAAEAAPAT